MFSAFKKLWPLAVLALAGSCGRSSPPAEHSTAAPIRGELIDPAPVAAPASTNAATADEASARRKHPKPPSTQRRMVMAEFVQLTQPDTWVAAMPSGTKGSAADLAKTNLPSLSDFPDLAAKATGYDEVTFERLGGFDFQLTKEMTDGNGNPDETERKAKAQIPSDISSLDGKKAVVEGFLLPVKMNEGLAVEFMLMRNQSMCCYGVPPKVNEWITVKLTGKGVKPVMDQPIAVAGILHVGPIEENGCLAGIYRMDGEKVIAPF